MHNYLPVFWNSACGLSICSWMVLEMDVVVSVSLWNQLHQCFDIRCSKFYTPFQTYQYFQAKQHLLPHAKHRMPNPSTCNRELSMVPIWTRQTMSFCSYSIISQIYIYIYTHIHTHTCIYIYIFIYIHLYMCNVCMHAYYYVNPTGRLMSFPVHKLLQLR